MKACLHQKDMFFLIQGLSSEVRYVLIFECYNVVVTLPRLCFFLASESCPFMCVIGTGLALCLNSLIKGI